MMQVSVRELKNNLSKYLRLVRTGEPIVVTSHKRALARLSSVDTEETSLESLLAGKKIRWSGKKPKGGRLRPSSGNKTLSERVLEDGR